MSAAHVHEAPQEPRATPALRAVLEWEKRRRVAVVALAAAAIACFAVSYFLPWWNFKLIAPQYPKGLLLVIHLTGVMGDVQEINTINHYIGMHPLDKAAQFERAWGGWMVGALATTIAGIALLAGRRLNALLAVVAVGLPVGFLADTMYWLYVAGHDLDPKAPIRLAAFTPTLFGDGKVGQFRTEAWPAVGFWIAVVAVGLVVAAMWQRMRVCRVCPEHDACGATCPHSFLSTPK